MNVTCIFMGCDTGYILHEGIWYSVRKNSVFRAAINASGVLQPSEEVRENGVICQVSRAYRQAVESVRF